MVGIFQEVHVQKWSQEYLDVVLHCKTPSFGSFVWACFVTKKVLSKSLDGEGVRWQSIKGFIKVIPCKGVIKQGSVLKRLPEWGFHTIFPHQGCGI